MGSPSEALTAFRSFSQQRQILDLACLMAPHPALRKAKFFQIASSSLTSTAEVFVVSTSGHEAIRSIQSILNGILATMPEKNVKVCEFGPPESLAPSFRHQLPPATCHKGMPPSCRMLTGTISALRRGRSSWLLLSSATTRKVIRIGCSTWRLDLAKQFREYR